MNISRLASLAEKQAGRLIRKTTKKAYRFSCAESCTGGLLASKITAIPGASAVFPGSIVSYENAVKHKLLFVPDSILNTVGAVSAPCAKAMAEGVRKQMDALFAVSITGIAGPGGATPAKPVGTVYFGLSLPSRTLTYHRVFPGNREEVRLQSVNFAFRLLLAASRAVFWGKRQSCLKQQ